MTTVRPVFDGNKVKYTLERQAIDNPHHVRVDWLRFTLPVDAVMRRAGQVETADLRWVEPFVAGHRTEDAGAFDGTDRAALVDLAVNILKTDPALCSTVSKNLCYQGFWTLAQYCGIWNGKWERAEDSGMDFYSARAPLMFEGAVVGYVLAGGKSAAQAHTIHFNFFGSACLHFTPEILASLARMVDDHGGWITRADLAYDVFEGFDIVELQKAWADGLFDVRGKRPTQREHGSWSSQHSRTFEVGSRGTGKLLRGYEKGDELFGHEAGDPWVRLEVEFRNSHRVLETDILRAPGDYFAGAYPWLADFVLKRGCALFPTTIPTNAEVKDKTAQAAVDRLVSWVSNTAGPSLKALWDMGGDLIADVIDRQNHRAPRRLRGHERQGVQKAFDRFARETKTLAAAFAPPSAPSFVGA